MQFGQIHTKAVLKLPLPLHNSSASRCNGFFKEVAAWDKAAKVVSSKQQRSAAGQPG